MLSRHKPRREFVDTKNLRHLARTPRTLVRSSLVARPVRGNSHQQHPCGALRTRRSRNRRRNYRSGSHLRLQHKSTFQALFTTGNTSRKIRTRTSAWRTKHKRDDREEARQFRLCRHFKPPYTTLAWDSLTMAAATGPRPKLVMDVQMDVQRVSPDRPRPKIDANDRSLIPCPQDH
jgi:hypothetical protein